MCVNITVTLKSEIGVTGNYLDWIKSYLINRRQYVTVSGTVSRKVRISSNVPQGLHISPILFLLFMMFSSKNSHFLFIPGFVS